ncbi:MAG: HAD-IA family hydrolase [Chitinivibrionia bacterium]|nr:HAD-IA family hydrolase [Chitinivibrionia bacterium]
MFSSSFGLRKPHPDIFYEASNLAGWAPSECVYIGDRYVEDVTGPTSIGMPAILKLHPERAYPPDLSYNVRRVRTLPELEQHFDL